MLSDVRAQPRVIALLCDWLVAPESGAMIFAGGTGVGKTVTAKALGRELGVVVDDGEMGGFYTIASGDMKKEAVEYAMRMLRLLPFFGSGWRVLLCNEAEVMSRTAEDFWLDALEDLPGKSLVIFTTNCVDKFSQRFADRCGASGGIYHFESRTEMLRGPIQQWCREIWHAELGDDVPYELGDNLGTPSLSGPDAMSCSFRHALSQLGCYIRAAKSTQKVSNLFLASRPR